MSIPLETLSLLGSSILGGIMQLWSMKLKAKAEERKFELNVMAQAQKGFKAARRYKGSKEYEWTKRTLAISAFMSIVVLPKVAALFAPIMGWDISVTYGWSEIESGFWFWSDDETKVVWKTAKGFTITPMDTHLVAAIAGLYFGSSVVKNA